MEIKKYRFWSNVNKKMLNGYMGVFKLYNNLYSKNVEIQILDIARDVDGIVISGYCELRTSEYVDMMSWLDCKEMYLEKVKRSKKIKNLINLIN